MRSHPMPTAQPICRRLEPPACAALWYPVAAAPHLGVATSAREELLHEEAKGAPPPPPPAGLRPVAPCGGGEGRDGRREACRRGFGGASRSTLFFPTYNREKSNTLPIQCKIYLS